MRKDIMQDSASVIDRVHQLMKKLRNPIPAAKPKQHTDLRVKFNNATTVALRMLERAVERKKYIVSQPREDRDFEDLQWSSRDIEAMLRRDQFQSTLQHFKNGTSAKKLKNMLFKEEGEETESTQEAANSGTTNPTKFRPILRFPKVRHRQLAVKWAFGRFPPISSTLLEGKLGEMDAPAP